MAESLDTRTSVTLLECLRRTPADEAAWSRFVDRYGPSLLEWCRRWGLQEADALDVVQIVLAKLAAKLRSFEYAAGGSFRGWLKTVTHNAWRDFVDGRDRYDQGSGDSRVIALIETVEARDDLTARIEAEHRREVFEEATRRVRLRVEQTTWEAFRLLSLEGRSGAEVAEAVGLNVAAVYMAKKRVAEMLREVVAEVGGADDD